mgnify:CR=1 FL=1
MNNKFADNKRKEIILKMLEFSKISILCYRNGYNIVDTVKKSAFYSLNNICEYSILVHNHTKMY